MSYQSGSCPHFRHREIKRQAGRVLLYLSVGVNLLSACTLRTDASYSTKVSELKAPAAEALIEPRHNESTSQTTPQTVPPAELVDTLKTGLAAEIGVPITEILVKEITPTQWNDACLGAANPNERCAQVVTPGYRIVLGTVLGTLTATYTFHTDGTGKNFRRVADAPPQTHSTYLKNP